MCWTVLKRLYEMNKESVDKAVIKRLQGELTEKEKQALWVQVHLWFFELLYLEWIIYEDIIVVFSILETRGSKNQRLKPHLQIWKQI